MQEIPKSTQWPPQTLAKTVLTLMCSYQKFPVAEGNTIKMMQDTTLPHISEYLHI
jgi:hypothetical protein